MNFDKLGLYKSSITTTILAFLVFSFLSLLPHKTLALTLKLGVMAKSSQFSLNDSSNNLYGLLGSSGAENRLNLLQFVGPIELELYGGTRSYIYKMPTNLPGTSALSEYNYSDTFGALRIGITKSNLQPYVVAGLDNWMYVSTTNPFVLNKQAINFAGIGLKVFGAAQSPSMLISGNVEIRYPVSGTEITSSQNLKYNYSTNVDVETRFGQKKMWGIIGTANFTNYSDSLYTYMNISLGTGLVVAF